MTPQDRIAKRRLDDEVELHRKISELLEEFSKKYYVDCMAIEVEKNNFYDKTSGPQPSMYNLNTYWKFSL